LSRTRSKRRIITWNVSIAGDESRLPHATRKVENIMKRPNENREREDRFTDEVVVDAYGEEERAMGWYYYAANNIAFPFKARCSLKRSTSPLKAGDVVEVTGMAAEDDCMQELMVLIKWDDEDLAVPLIQLESPGSTGLTRQVLADWKYWVDRGYSF